MKVKKLYNALLPFDKAVLARIYYIYDYTVIIKNTFVIKFRDFYPLSLDVSFCVKS